MPVVVTAAVYQLTKDKNLTADPANQAFSIQTGEIRSRGLELEAKAAVNANINVTAAYSYTDAGVHSRYGVQRQTSGGSAA